MLLLFAIFYGDIVLDGDDDALKRLSVHNKFGLSEVTLQRNSDLATSAKSVNIQNLNIVEQ